MIPNNDKHIYVILDTTDTATCYAPVIAWAESGFPLILDEDGLTEVRLDNFPGFGGVHVLKALYGAASDGALGSHRVTVKRDQKPFKSRFADLAANAGKAEPLEYVYGESKVKS